jgi:exosortase E/protease (VPEID-CTERM system)
MDTRAPHRGRPGSSSSAALLELPLQSPGSVFLLRRAFALALLFALELAALSIWLDDAALVGRGGLAGFVQSWGAWILRGIVGFAALFGTFAWLRNRAVLEDISPVLAHSPFGWRWLAGHASAMLCFAALSFWLYGAPLPAAASNALVVVWFITGAAAIALAALAFCPARIWQKLARGTGSLWALALVAILFACVAGNYSRTLWAPASRLTFALAEAMLKPFTSAVVADPTTMNLGTPRFQVFIAPECSGFEGVGLMIAFGVAWLFLFRREIRFPQALLLIPVGVVLIYLLNAARLAALILIGDAGAERIALGGFHSQAGWIAFNFVALAFCVTARHVPWFAARDARAQHPRPVAAENPAAAWLMPFVVILAAGMISRAASGDFEWLYPLRFAAAAVTLWWFRRKYLTLEWRASWIAPAAGILVFILWIAMDRTGTPAADATPADLTAASSWARALWIVIRVLAGAVTVPIAEELAFRGYLLRRLVSADFESVQPQFSFWIALLISSVIFGLLHGNRWFAGTVAGVVYGLIYMRRGRIVEAILAHGVTNALLAVDVLAFHHWHQW